MFLRNVMPVFCVVASLALIIGCGGSNSAPSNSSDSTSAPIASDSKTDSGHDEHGEGHEHSHERGKMLIADAGPYHALLTAHLAPAGNELDIFLETPVSENPQPVAIPVASFEAQATSGDGEAQTLTFEPAPAEERPAGEKEGAYSHFVAKAPWMKPEDELLVVAKFTVEGKEIVARWKEFQPQKYAHHVE